MTTPKTTRKQHWKNALRQALAIRTRKQKLRAVRTLFKHIRAALWPAI